MQLPISFKGLRVGPNDFIHSTSGQYQFSSDLNVN